MQQTDSATQKVMEKYDDDDDDDDDRKVLVSVIFVDSESKIICITRAKNSFCPS